LLGFVRSPAPAQQEFTQTLCRLSPEIATAELAQQFYRMMRERNEAAWLSWRKAARQSRWHDLPWNCNAMKLPCELRSCFPGVLDQSKKVTFIA